MSAVRGWETIASLLIGLLAGLLLPPRFYAESSAEIVTIFSLVIAAVVPTMMLTATSLKTSLLSVGEIRSLSKQIESQTSLFGGLFIYSLFAGIAVIIFVSTKWVSYGPVSLPTAFVTFFLCFLFLRSLVVVLAVRNFARLSLKMAELSAVERVRTTHSEVADYEMPQDYGRPIE